MVIHITVKFKTEPATLSVIKVINGNQDVWFSVTVCMCVCAHEQTIPGVSTPEVVNEERQRRVPCDSDGDQSQSQDHSLLCINNKPFR